MQLSINIKTLFFKFLFCSTGHGSSLSLVSSSSSLYSSQEEKQAAEIRKLRKDLADAQDKVGTLTNQLTTNVSQYCDLDLRMCLDLKSVSLCKYINIWLIVYCLSTF